MGVANNLLIGLKGEFMASVVNRSNTPAGDGRGELTAAIFPNKHCFWLNSECLSLYPQININLTHHQRSTSSQNAEKKGLQGVYPQLMYVSAVKLGHLTLRDSVKEWVGRRQKSDAQDNVVR